MSANPTTTTIITSQRSSNQNGSGDMNLIINSNSDPTEDDDSLGGIRDRLDVQGRIDDLIASVTNNTEGGGNGVADMRVSGNIASAQFNLSNGQVEQTYFGNWSLQVRSINNASFEADFDGTGGTHYRIYNFTMNSFQLVNDHVVLGGTADISESSQNQSWEKVAVSILVANGRNLSISFGEPELDEIFSGQPIYGVAAE
ncbi:MAG TPA: hypothetical protein VF172_06080 [Nitrososphaera sp.]